MSRSNFRRGRNRAYQLKRVRTERLEKKLFLIICEGAKTERGYFFNLESAIKTGATLKIPKTKDRSSPQDLLVDMTRSLQEYETEIKKTLGEAWIVLDKDNWEPDQLEMIYNWAKEKKHYNVAISNPKFEYWLILHYECGTKPGAKRKESCESYLKRKYIPTYKKGKSLPSIIFDCGRVIDAIRRGKVRDSSRCKKWPHYEGCTTVYRLVERIINTKQLN